MNFGKFLEGLNILAGYINDLENYRTSAEHDEFFVQIDSPVSDIHKQKLEDLGWLDDRYTDDGTGWKVFT